MLIRKCMVTIGILFAISASYAQGYGDGLGQTIEINTHLNSLVGKPSWLIEIHDLDNQQTIPYLFDFTQTDHYWLAFTYSHDYLITVSTLQSNKFHSRYNDYTAYKITNFCHLESHGRIQCGESIVIYITGDLTANPDSINCQVTKYKDPNFSIATPKQG